MPMRLPSRPLSRRLSVRSSMMLSLPRAAIRPMRRVSCSRYGLSATQEPWGGFVRRVVGGVWGEGGGKAGRGGLGLAIGRGRITVHRSEISLGIDQRGARGEGLGEADPCVVDGKVSVRMVFAHHVADDAGAFARRSAG